MSPERGALGLDGCLDGIDVSRVQGRIDWRAVAAAGFTFAACKATEGAGYVDQSYAANMAGATDAGLYTLSYAFARPTVGDVRPQLETLWRALPSAGLVALDLEVTGGLTPAQIADFANRWIAGWASYSAITPIVYTGKFFGAELGGVSSDSPLSRCPLWLAQYRSTTIPWAPTMDDWPRAVHPWAAATLWQYSGNGGYRVPGVPGDCDRDLFRGEEAALRAMLGLPSAA